MSGSEVSITHLAHTHRAVVLVIPQLTDPLDQCKRTGFYRTDYLMHRNQVAELIDMVRVHPDAEYDRMEARAEAAEAERDQARAEADTLRTWHETARACRNDMRDKNIALAAELARVRGAT